MILNCYVKPVGSNECWIINGKRIWIMGNMVPYVWWGHHGHNMSQLRMSEEEEIQSGEWSIPQAITSSGLYDMLWEKKEWKRWC